MEDIQYTIILIYLVICTVGILIGLNKFNKKLEKNIFDSFTLIPKPSVRYSQEVINVFNDIKEHPELWREDKGRYTLEKRNEDISIWICNNKDGIQFYTHSYEAHIKNRIDSYNKLITDYDKQLLYYVCNVVAKYNTETAKQILTEFNNVINKITKIN